MSKSALSVLVFSLYMFSLGTILLLYPNILLKIFSIPETNEVWIRVVGMLVCVLGYYYLQASRNEIKAFFKWSVLGRTSVLFFFIAFVLFNLAPPILILFGVFDAVAAFWTHSCLKKEQALH